MRSRKLLERKIGQESRERKHVPALKPSRDQPLLDLRDKLALEYDLVRPDIVDHCFYLWKCLHKVQS
jgi:hypothetical protein